MKVVQKFDFTNFEVMSETNSGILLGGFSTAIENSSLRNRFEAIITPKANNCQAMNCVGCGRPE